MGAKYLIDTNTVIELVTQLLPPAGSAWVDEVVWRNEQALSVINWIELLVKPKSALEKAVLEEFIANAAMLPVDAAVVAQAVQVRQQNRIKLPDAIVAATALAHNLVLVSRNTSDFANIPGLVVVNPHNIMALPVL